jgi:acetoin utilization protein AcuB
MRIRDIMSTNVVAVDEKTSIHDARKIMEVHKIRRLPVLRKDRLVGLVTKHMLLEASPSKATSLSIHELHYLLANMTVKDIMVKNPRTISPDMPPEEAMQLGQEMGYGGFPVIENDRLVGMVTESDIVRLMTRVLGVAQKGMRIAVKVPALFGNVQKIMAILDSQKVVLLSLLSYKEPDEEEWLIILRLDGEKADSVVRELSGAGFNVTYAA